MNTTSWIRSGALVVLLGAASLVFGQKQIADQQNSWFMYFGNHRLSERLSVHTEYQWRREGLGKTWQQSLLRLGLDYHSDPANILSAGYGWIVSFPYGEQPISETFTEHRLWEQWISTHRAGRLYVNHRYRLEQRFLERPAEDRYVFRQRIRYRLLLTYALGSRDLQDDQFFLAAYGEPFLGFGKGIGKNILDQNRLYLALGYRFNARSNIQIGYMNQYIVKPDGILQERNHNLQVGITHNLDLR